MNEEESVPQPIYTAPPPEHPAQAAPKSRKPFILIFVALLIIAAGMGGGYYYAMSTKKSAPAPTVSPTAAPKKIVVTEDPMGSWEVYTGTLNYEFKYPVGWKKEGSELVSPIGQTLTVYENPTTLPTTCYIKLNEQTQSIKGLDIVATYYKGDESTTCNKQQSMMILATIKNDTDTIVLMYEYPTPGGESSEKTLNDVLSTFTFTFGTSLSGVENTTVCTNADLKIQINVPKEFTCTSGNRTLTLGSTNFDVTISDFGRGGPCPLYNEGTTEADAQPRCVETLFHSTQHVIVNMYKENNEVQALFGEVGKATPNQSMTWIDIVYKPAPSTEPTGLARTELAALLDAIKPL